MTQEPANIRVIRTYETSGFQWLKTVPVIDDDNPLDSGDEYVMILATATFSGAGEE